MTSMMIPDGHRGQAGAAANGARYGARLRRWGQAAAILAVAEASAKAIELAQTIAANAPLTNYALMHALPRIAEQPADHGYLTEALISSIAQAAPEAKARVRAFLDGKAAKVGQRS